MKKSKLARIASIALATAFTLSAGAMNACGAPPLPEDDRNLTAQQYSLANLTAVDDYGREVDVCNPLDLKTAKQVKNGDRRYVGIFYSLWLGTHMEAYDGEIYCVHELEKLGSSSPLYQVDHEDSPDYRYHFASEPLYGFYSMRDPWVVSRHVELLTMAGVDYLMIDHTNWNIYEDANKVLLDVLLQYHNQGWNVPKVAYYTNTGSKVWVERIYNSRYDYDGEAQDFEKYDDLWFRFEEDPRPVIVGVSDKNDRGTDQPSQEPIDSNSDLYKFFNFYESQWPSGAVNEELGFPWMHWGTNLYNNNGNIAATVVQHSSGDPYVSRKQPCSSRGYNGTTVESDWKKGGNFNWQWSNIHTFSEAGVVRNVLCTGWNEWIAVKNPDSRINYEPLYTGDVAFFCDAYNAEYSRDLEMGKEYGDGFYNQLIQNTRKFKYGAQSKYLMNTKTIDITDLSDWNGVEVVYKDFVGDARARDGENAANVAHSYVDNSNRNDIAEIKMVHDDQNLYVMVKTAEDITAYESGDKNWMNLMISTGKSDKDYMSFDYIINRTPNADGTTSVEKCSTNDTYAWTNAGTANYEVSGDTIVYEIPLTVLGLSANDVSFSFKVSDNVLNPEDKMSYYIYGDSAPIGRLSYAYNKATAVAE